MNAGAALADRLAARIRAEGPISYAEFVETALYDEDAGFYARHGSAGRRGDFLTSPEVGPLFGAVIARALDEWWRELGEPARYRVVEAGAGRGTLARAVLAATPACAVALDYVMVERSRRLRAEHPAGAVLRSLELLPDEPAPGVVLANELLDNMAFDLAEWDDGAWHDVRVDVDESGALVERRGAAVIDATLPAGADGARVPRQVAAQQWLRSALELVPAGRVVVVDYARSTAEMVDEPWTAWVRTYRGHDRGRAPLDDPGGQDVTCDVAIDQLAAVQGPDLDRSQADFLRAHGLDELVADGRRVWSERAGVGDLAALRARSRVREAEALTAADGLGAFRVLEWTRGRDQRFRKTDSVS
jgi:SAM-dependent MidA family methyltransferase